MMVYKFEDKSQQRLEHTPCLVELAFTPVIDSVSPGVAGGLVGERASFRGASREDFLSEKE
ncbi:hypothetical protein [Chlorogloeopsis sp. ULAP02]|uniref:hypothetical protein n=1 Tax=Chlorogloeopsis sp. ULAP02 TaxID=3107926 RepID=UPI0031351788